MLPCSWLKSTKYRLISSFQRHTRYSWHTRYISQYTFGKSWFEIIWKLLEKSVKEVPAWFSQYKGSNRFSIFNQAHFTFWIWWWNFKILFLEIIFLPGIVANWDYPPIYFFYFSIKVWQTLVCYFCLGYPHMQSFLW